MINVTVNSPDSIQNYLNIAKENGGDTVLLAPGTYTLTSDIFIPSRVNLEGQSRDNCVIECGDYSIYLSGENAYTDGTVTLNSGDTTVVGTGTTWTADMVGQYIFLDGAWYEISAFSDTEHLDLVDAYFGSDLSGAGYAIADPNFNSIIRKLTIINSIGAGVVCAYASEPQFDDLIIYDNITGMDLDYVYAPLVFVSTFFNEVNADFNYVSAYEIKFSAFDQATVGAGIKFTNCISATFFDSEAAGNTGNGIEITNCNNISFISFNATANGSNGIEMISGNTDVQFTIIEVSDNIASGLKLTDTSERVSVSHGSVRNNGTYGIDIANANCSNNILVGLNIDSNGTASINDLGTGTLKSTAVNNIA